MRSEIAPDLTMTNVIGLSSSPGEQITVTPPLLIDALIHQADRFEELIKCEDQAARRSSVRPDGHQGQRGTSSEQLCDPQNEKGPSVH
jgi:hypothetical protein